jgi:hypothetical protein
VTVAVAAASMDGMANRHFGKIADVWKHAALMEAIGRVAPGRYAETHAGPAAYPMVRDSEREFVFTSYRRP